MNTDVAMAISFSLVPIALGFVFLRLRLRKIELIEKIIEHSENQSVELLRIIQKSEQEKETAEIKVALFFTALGIGLALLFGLQTFGNSPRWAFVGVIPICLGVGFFLMAKVTKAYRGDK